MNSLLSNHLGKSKEKDMSSISVQLITTLDICTYEVIMASLNQGE